MWRMDWYSSATPLAPSMSRAVRAISRAWKHALRFAMLTCTGVTLPASLRRPRRKFISCAFVISVSMCASLAW